MPQTPSTGKKGIDLIRAALQRENVFRGKNITVNAIPTSADSIRFDIHIQTGMNQPVTLSINQNLGA